MSNHGAKHIGDPNSTFGRTKAIPSGRKCATSLCAPGEFPSKRPLNEQAADYRRLRGDPHCRPQNRLRNFVRQSAMQKFDAPFDVVITTNSGYPLDQNLYQGVKGMSAGARVIKSRGHADPGL